MDSVYDNNNLAKAYADLYKRVLPCIYSEHYTLLKEMGDLLDKSVLDLACGSGGLTREIAKLSPNELVGVDESTKMIELAKAEEDKNPFGIKYVCKRVGNLGIIGEFDFVTAAHLLHYSKTKEELFLMCKDIFNNLKPGGKFVAVNMNPEKSVSKKKTCHVSFEGDSFYEGIKLKIELFNEKTGELECPAFFNYYWSKKTYEEAFISAGFKKVLWKNFEVSKEGMKEYSSTFWKEYTEKSNLILVEAYK